MKKAGLISLPICLILGWLNLGVSQPDVGTQIRKGSRTQTSVVNVTSTTAATILNANAYRMDLLIYNTSTSNVLYIGSYTAITGDANVDSGGFEIPAASWWSSDGKYVGVLYGKGVAGGSGTTNVVKVIELVIP